MYKFVLGTIVPRLEPDDRAALSVQAPLKDNHAAYNTWQANLYAAALHAQSSLLSYLSAREFLQKEAATAVDNSAAPPTKKHRGRRVGVMGATIHSVAGRMESLKKRGEEDWLNKVLSSEEEMTALARASGQAGQGEADQAGEDEEDDDDNEDDVGDDAEQAQGKSMGGVLGFFGFGQ